MARKQQDTPEPEETQPPETDAAAAERSAGDPAEDASDGARTTAPDAAEAPDAPASEADAPETEATAETETEAGDAPPDLSAPHDPEPVDLDYHEPENDHEHDPHELDEHGHFPTWLKVMLILLLGAGIALWAGPRIAPHLPSGLDPVARFLTPGAVRQAAEIDARLSALEQQEPPAPAVPDAEIDAAVQSALQRYDTDVRADLDRLRDTVSAVDGADIQARLSKVETAVEGLEAQMATLNERLSTAVTEGIDQQAARSAEQDAALQATLDRLSAQIDGLSERQGTLQQAIDEVSATNARIKQEAESVVGASQAAKAATDIAVALETGAPFAPALQTLRGAVEAELPALQAVAESGVQPLAALKAQFPGLAHEALRAALRAEAEGYTGKALAFFRAQVATRSLSPQPGDSTDAVLSRIDAALAEGDLAAVQQEAQGLSDAARAPLAGWLASVRRLADAQADLSAATAELSRQKS